MPIVAALCTQCGARVEVDSNKEAAICPHCNTPYIVEKAITNYNTNVTNNFSGATINIAGYNIDNLIQMARLSQESKDYKTAIESCDKVLLLNAENYNAWEIKSKCIGWVDSTLASPKCYEALAMAKKAIAFAPPEKKPKMADDLQEEICLQTMGLINIYSQMNSLGQVMHRPTFATLMKTYLEALELPYVSKDVLIANCKMILQKLNADDSYAEILFDISIKDAQNNFNNGKKYTDDVDEIQKRGINENELNYWKDYPEVISSQKLQLLSELESDLALWNDVNQKYIQLNEEYEQVEAVIKKNQFKLWGDGAKLRKENETKASALEKEIRQIEKEYSKREKTHTLIERKIEFLKSI